MPLIFAKDDDNWIYIVIAIVVIIGIILFAFVFSFFKLWFRALLSKADISLLSLVGMHFRKVNANVIVNAKIMIAQAGILEHSGIKIRTEELEAHYLAGGNILLVIRALIAANRANIKLDFKTATGIDLAGRNILEAVQSCVNPKVIDCPDPGKGRRTIDAVAKDGIQLKAKARVTIRTNIDKLVGGATEETIIARVGEGIVTTIGSADNYQKVLENPDTISKKIMEKGLDAGTAFEILSIDIADVDVGDNIGAKLQAEQAEADMRRARAEAEARRANAVAREQENIALVKEKEAEVKAAEAEIPKAIASALNSGNIGVMDYYKFKNIQSDTTMRNSIAGIGGEGSTAKKADPNHLDDKKH
jgi:uncharacterized protein YqfA (UPF0365 family)